MPDPRSPRAHAPLLALLALAALPAAGGPRDPLYRWSDDAGNVRYTTERQRIPLTSRDEAVRVALPPEPEPPIPTLDEREPREASPPAEAPDLPPIEAGGAAVGVAAPPGSPLDARIAALERAIADDEETLTEHISDPARAARLQESEEVNAIAERLPRLQAELRALRAQRDAAAPDAP